MRNLISKATFATIIMALSGISSFAADDWGPALGSSLPAGLTASAPNGDDVSLEALGREGNGLAIAFVRSADWCPFCKRQLIELSERAADFEKRGLTLVSISYDNTDVLGGFTEQFDIGFRLLSDPESKVIDAFGIRNEDQKPGSAGEGIPHPGIMVFNSKGELTAKFAEKSYRKRPKIDDVLAAFDAAAGR
ncbi:MAG: peroxiredoxin family protein [Gammaproteobacteria bacterium]